MEKYCNQFYRLKNYTRLLSKLALLEKIKNFCGDLLRNFEGISEDIVENFDNKDTKKTDFSKQMESIKAHFSQKIENSTQSVPPSLHKLLLPLSIEIIISRLFAKIRGKIFDDFPDYLR
jgi:hypothetical protein